VLCGWPRWLILPEALAEQRANTEAVAEAEATPTVEEMD
jgi:hypothetical protein